MATANTQQEAEYGAIYVGNAKSCRETPAVGLRAIHPCLHLWPLSTGNALGVDANHHARRHSALLSIGKEEPKAELGLLPKLTAAAYP